MFFIVLLWENLIFDICLVFYYLYFLECNCFIDDGRGDGFLVIVFKINIVIMVF